MTDDEYEMFHDRYYVVYTTRDNVSALISFVLVPSNGAGVKAHVTAG